MYPGCSNVCVASAFLSFSSYQLFLFLFMIIFDVVIVPFLTVAQRNSY